METLEKVGLVAGGGLLVAVALAVATRQGTTAPGGGSTPTPTPTPTGTTVFHHCWAYYATDSGRGYILDDLGLVHYVRDACAWYQAGYPYPVNTAAHTTEAQIQAYGAAHGTGPDVCNNDGEACLSQGTNNPNSFGCAYTKRPGFTCAWDGHTATCPNPQVLGGFSIYSDCPGSAPMQPLAGTPCSCSDGWYDVRGAGYVVPAMAMTASALGSRV